jgi:peptide/nickel transport system substrate-binding protein
VLGVDNFQRAFSSSVGGYVDNPSYSNVVFVHDLTPTS